MNSYHLLLLIPLLAPIAACRAAVCKGPVEVNGDATALSGCRAVDGDLLVTGEIADPRTLEALTSVRNLAVIGTSFEDLSAFRSLREVSGLTIQGNARLASLRGLEGIRGLEGLVIAENESLVTLDGLENLSRAREMVVAKNPSLESIEALERIESVDELDVSAESNPSLAADQVERLRARAARELALGE